MQPPARKAARANDDCLFDTTLTADIAQYRGRPYIIEQTNKCKQ